MEEFLVTPERFLSALKENLQCQMITEKFFSWTFNYKHFVYQNYRDLFFSNVWNSVTQWKCIDFFSKTGDTHSVLLLHVYWLWLLSCIVTHQRPILSQENLRLVTTTGHWLITEGTVTILHNNKTTTSPIPVSMWTGVDISAWHFLCE